MRIIDENGIEVNSPDLEKGYLKNDSLLIMHHEEIKAVEETGHYEVIAEYPNGGKDVKWVVDVPGVEAKEAWDEYEDVLRYVAYTEVELKLKEYERNRNPMTAMHVLEMLIPNQINTIEVDDNTALRMMPFYPEWKPCNDYAEGFKLRYKDKLWKIRQAHTSQAGWSPDLVPALFEQINETHSGTVDDPIPYDGNMVLDNGLHYYQGGVIYLCNRDSINPVYHSLNELVGLYVELV
jgi:hypothetical protein